MGRRRWRIYVEFLVEWMWNGDDDDVVKLHLCVVCMWVRELQEKKFCLFRVLESGAEPGGKSTFSFSASYRYSTGRGGVYALCE